MEEPLPAGVKPSPFMIWFAVLIVVLGYIGIFGWLLVDTLRHSASFDVRPAQSYVLPPFAGALGLVLALSLGVDPTKKIYGRSLKERLKRLLSVDHILLFGGIAYLVSAVAGFIVWAVKGNITPELVTTVVLTVVGYLAAAATQIARTP